MKYTQEITIDKPLAKVAELFNNPANMKYWRPEPIGIERIGGTPGEPGAKSKLHFEKFDLLETITARDSPAGFSAIGEVHHLTSTAKFSFSPLGANQTLYTLEIEYKFKTLMAKLMGLFMPGMFKRQTFTYMRKFKDFAERG